MHAGNLWAMRMYLTILLEYSYTLSVFEQISLL